MMHRTPLKSRGGGGGYDMVSARKKNEKKVDGPIPLARQSLDVASSARKERTSSMYVSVSEV